MSVISYQGIKYSSTGIVNVNDKLSEERALQITINNEVFSITMRTPGDDHDLVRGLLFSEDIYTKNQNLIPKKEEKGESTIDNCILEIEGIKKGYSNSKNLLSSTSCGICGSTQLVRPSKETAVLNKGEVSLADLKIMYEKFQSHQGDFEQSGGSHAAAAFDNQGQLLSIKEDVGRHNAVDKVVGNLINNGILSQANVLLLSGRISYELVVKTFKAKIPVLAAISAPSSLAVDFAKELGITILGFCRENRATCYANPFRIKT